MDDLISRKAAIEAIVSQSIYETRETIAEAVRNDYRTSEEWLGGINDAISTIEEMNAVPAVPLDKLCKWLQENALLSYKTPLSVAGWKYELTQWMEEQDTAD